MSLSRKAFIGATCALLAFAGAAQAAEDSMDTVLGKAVFERLWVSAPSSTKAADGLGPLFNARACSSCHQGGGRAKVALQEGYLPASAGLTLRVGAAKDVALVPHRREPADLVHDVVGIATQGGNGGKGGKGGAQSTHGAPPPPRSA